MRSAIAAIIMIGMPLTALADSGPVIVIPSYPGVPTLINGVYDRPDFRVLSVGRYYPSSGRIPGYGRVEIEPPADRLLPPEAESHTRSWGAASYPPQQTQPPLYPPPVIVAPQINGPRFRPDSGPSPRRP